MTKVCSIKSHREINDATYGSQGLTARLLQNLQAAGCDIAALTADDLLAFDELHVMGRAATLALGRLAGLKAGMRVLDLGSGVGGPARTLAAAFGCQVTGVDLCAEFTAAAAELTRRVGLAALVDFRQADALDLPFSDGTFDAVVMLHICVNLPDKAALFSEARRVLKPGGQLALWELCRGENADLIFPVPWAADPAGSFLVSSTELTAALQAAGFKQPRLEDATAETAEWVRERMNAAGQPRPKSRRVDLDLILPDFRLKRANLSKNLLQGGLRVMRGLARRERDRSESCSRGRAGHR